MIIKSLMILFSHRQRPGIRDGVDEVLEEEAGIRWTAARFRMKLHGEPWHGSVDDT
jgi:hypothetical protein